jgi:nicotinamide-nucleotide amidase
MLPEQAVAAAISASLTIACGESVTGGLVCSALVSVPGASDAVAGGVVAYTIPAKVGVLGVDAAIIQTHGVVSEEVALAMARRARDLFRADIGVGTTGAAGPADHGGKPAGTVCVASVGPAGEFATTTRFGGDRGAVREAAARAALVVLGYALGEAGGESVVSKEHP